MSKFIIRRMGADDWKSVKELVRFIEEAGGLGPHFHWPQDLLDAELRSSFGFGIFQAAELCGFVLYRDMLDVWDISVVASHPNWRRQGVMERLFSEVVAAKGRERALVLEVHEENLPAQKLYEKLGFREVRRRPRYYSDGGTALVYTLSAEASEAGKSR